MASVTRLLSGRGPSRAGFGFLLLRLLGLSNDLGGASRARVSGAEVDGSLLGLFEVGSCFLDGLDALSVARKQFIDVLEQGIATLSVTTGKLLWEVVLEAVALL